MSDRSERSDGNPQQEARPDPDLIPTRSSADSEPTLRAAPA